MQEKKCKYTIPQIGQYMMNKMSMEEETLFQEHLYSCPVCHQKLQEMRKLAAALSDKHPSSTVKKEQKKRLFAKVFISIALFITGSTGIYLWLSRTPETTIIHETPPVLFHHADTLQHKDSLDSINVPLK